MIPLTPVQSSQLHAVGFDPVTGTLAIQFKNSAGPSSVYHYSNFSQEAFDNFKSAESLGRYFGTNIKGNPDYPHTKIEQDKDAEQQSAA